MAVTLLVLVLVAVKTANSAPLSSSNDGPHIFQHLTVPSLVSQQGHHISHTLPSLPQHHQSLGRDISQDASGGRIYIKLPAFGETLYLNLSLSSSDLAGMETLVNYVRGDGSIQTQSRAPGSCHYTGHVHSDAGDSLDGGIGRAREESWTAVSTCNGLRGILVAGEEQLAIEPASHTEGGWGNGRQHTITKSRGDLHSYGDAPPSSSECSAVEGSGSLTSGGVKRSKRLVTAPESYVETVVVADQSMLDLHDKENLEAYIFTLMNIVSHLFRDASIGQHIKVTLLRVVILESNQSFAEAASSRDLLDEFCNWMSRYEQSRAWHHDIAVLLTRRSTCETQGSSCNTLGMANVGSTCSAGRSCNVNRDKGLSTAFTIAHEMGHNLGMTHDGEMHDGCKSEEKLIMAPSFAESANPHMWSECSKRQLADFLSSPRSSCLSDRPPESAETFPDSLLLPGMQYTPTEQCRLHLTSSASHCPGKQDECAAMWCRADNDSACVNLVTPLAPGTECDLPSSPERGVCHQGQCVAYQEVASPVHGGWSQWEEWTNCSLPCGTGIQHRDRHCNSPQPRNGGHYCSGERRQYHTCNQQVCPEGEEADVRQTLCETSAPREGLNWKTVSLDRISHLELDACRSHCFATDAQDSVIHSTLPTLPNGTPCLTSSASSQGACLSGHCKAISCTGELGGESERDRCGVWCGDGTSCVPVAGAFNQVIDMPREDYQYYPALTIPAGSTHISVSEVSSSESNFLALEGLQTRDFINGHYQVLPAGTQERQFAGNRWTFQRPHGAGSPRGAESAQVGVESARTPGPVDEDIEVYILANSNYDGIHFTFNLQTSDFARLRQPVYFWNVSEWSACSVGCGRGRQERGVACWMIHPGGRVEEARAEMDCGLLEDPGSEQECVVEQCQYQWMVLEWDPCNVSCGVGAESRTVRCVSHDMGGVAVEEHLCSDEMKPSLVQECHQEACRYQWRHGEWGTCDAPCGEGWMEREVWCEREGRPGDEVKEALCEGVDRPGRTGRCHAPQPCSRFQWSMSTWSECVGECGEEGRQLRTASCQHENGTQVAFRFCSWHPSPATQRTCSPQCTTTSQATPPTTPTPALCVDKSSRTLCAGVVKHNVCGHSIYRTICCASCSAV